MSKVQVDKIVNLSDDGAPQLTYGAELPVGYGLTGAGGLNISGVVTAASAVFSGNVTIGGTLTYEDVTNIDVVGVSTFAGRMNVNSTINANEGIKVIGVSTLAAVTGTTGTFSGAVSGTTGTFSSDLSIAQKIVHTGDTHTYIDFGSDSIALNTAGSLALQVVSDQKVGIGTNNPQQQLDVRDTTAGAIRVSNASKSADFICNATGALIRTIGSYPLVFNTNQTDIARFDASGRLLIGTTASRSANSAQGSFQIEGTGAEDSDMSIIRNQASAGGPAIVLGKSRNASLAGNTVVQDGDQLGAFVFVGNDGTDLTSQGARIDAYIDGTPGSNDMPGRLTFSTTADGAASSTERLRITNKGMLEMRTLGSSWETAYDSEAGAPNIIRFTDTDTSTAGDQGMGSIQWWSSDASGSGACVKGEICVRSTDTTPEGYMQFKTHDSGTAPQEWMRLTNNGTLQLSSHTGSFSDTTVGLGFYFQRIGTDGGKSSGCFSRFSANASPSQLAFMKSRNATPGSHTIVQSGDKLGSIRFSADDGVNYNGQAATIDCEVDGTPGADDLPGRLIFSTSADGSDSPTKRLTITKDGHLLTHAATDMGILTLRDANNEIPSILTLQRGDSGDGVNNGDVIGTISFAVNDGTYASGIQTSRAEIRGVSQNTSSAARLEFYTGPNTAAVAERMRIAGDGTVGINTSIAGGRYLEVYAPANYHPVCFRNNQDVYATMEVVQMSTNSGAQLVQFRTALGGSTVGTITHNGSNTVSYNTSSDYRLKENAAAITDGIARLKTLKPYRFNWKSVGAGTTVDGFFAHEVTAVPEAVTGEKDAMKAETFYEEGDSLPSGKKVGDIKTYSSSEIDSQQIDQAKLVPLLTAALQEAVEETESLKTLIKNSSSFAALKSSL